MYYCKVNLINVIYLRKKDKSELKIIADYTQNSINYH